MTHNYVVKSNIFLHCVKIISKTEESSFVDECDCVYTYPEGFTMFIYEQGANGNLHDFVLTKKINYTNSIKEIGIMFKQICEAV